MDEIKESTNNIIQSEYELLTERAKFDELIMAGNYEWVNPFISPRGVTSSVINNQHLVYRLFGFLNCSIFTEEVLARILIAQCRPATLWELLQFGREFPHIQKIRPVVALGSQIVCDDVSLVAQLCCCLGSRILHLAHYSNIWEYQLFLAIDH